MKTFFVLACLTLAVPALAGTQQNKMKDCNSQAKEMKGQDRKNFMKKCLSKDSITSNSAAPAAPATPATPAKSATPQQRMKECSAQAKGKSGDDRKSFMSSCLKSSASNTPAAM